MRMDVGHSRITQQSDELILSFMREIYSTHKVQFSAAALLAFVRAANNIAMPYLLAGSLEALQSEDDALAVKLLAGFTATWLGSKIILLAKDEILVPINSKFSHLLTLHAARAGFNLPMLQRVIYSTPPQVHHFGIAYEHIGKSFVDGIVGKILPSSLDILAAVVLVSSEFGLLGTVVAGMALSSLITLLLNVKKVSTLQNDYIYGLMKSYAFIISKLDEYANVHYFGALPRQLKLLNEGTSRLDNALNRSILVKNRVDFTQYIVSIGIALLGAGIYYLYNTKEDPIELETFVWFMLYLTQLSHSVKELGGTASKFMADYQSFRSLTEFVQGANREKTTGNQLLNLNNRVVEIVFKGVHFSYDNGNQVLDGLDLIIPAGKVVIITGSSGAGKSSIFKILQRFYKQQAGQITIDGKDINDLNVESLRSNIAIVPQNPILDDTSISENIRYANINASEETLMDAIRLAGLEEFVTDKGFDFVVGTNGDKISGGQKQRLAIARAYLKKDCPILLMDEPTSALDPSTKEGVLTALSELLNVVSRTTLIISHDISTVKYLQEHVDRIVYLDDGKVAEEGSLQELLERDGLFASQMRCYTPQPLLEYPGRFFNSKNGSGIATSSEPNIVDNQSTTLRPSASVNW